VPEIERLIPERGQLDAAEAAPQDPHREAIRGAMLARLCPVPHRSQQDYALFATAPSMTLSLALGPMTTALRRAGAAQTWIPARAAGELYKRRKRFRNVCHARALVRRVSLCHMSARRAAMPHGRVPGPRLARTLEGRKHIAMEPGIAQLPARPQVPGIVPARTLKTESGEPPNASHAGADACVPFPSHTERIIRG
jgi:hypothetical protein